MKRATFWASLGAAGFGVLFFAAAMWPRGEDKSQMQLSRFSQVPVIDGGRVKPIDTYARVQLMLMSRRQTWYEEIEKGKEIEHRRREAVRWLLNILADGYAEYLPSQMTSQFLAIPDPEVVTWLGLRPRPIGRYTIGEILVSARKANRGDIILRLLKPDARPDSPIEQKVQALLQEMNKLRDQYAQEADALRQVRDKAGSPEKAKVFRIDNDQVLAMLNLEPREGFRYSLSEFSGVDDKRNDHRKYFQQFLKKAMEADKRPEKEQDLVDVKTLELYRQLKTHYGLVQLGGLLLVPGPSGGKEDWKTLGRALAEGDAGDNPSAAALEKIVRAYAQDDVKTFNKELGAYLATMQERMPGEMSKVRHEVWFNHFAPFYQCANLYVLVLLLSILSWVLWHEPLKWSAFWLTVVIVAVHTFALGLRMWLTGRPPVTNLYTSAVFIGWGCVLLCLLVEVILWAVSIRSFAIPLVVSSVLGFATMIVAHHLGGSGDTMEVMQAVLDTNFWLATHVVAVTLGYTATFVAGFFAMVFVFLMLATAVRKYFVDRAPPAGSDVLLFIVAVMGWLAIPTLLVLGVFCGLWVLWSGGEVLSVGVAVVLSLPLLLTAGIYGCLVVVRRFSPAPADAPPGELPPMVTVLDRLALTQTSSKVMSWLIYGTVCFATLLSFVGTVLGGIWADQSWGRFWGWDPKENGALLIVVMNALILHARWGGMIRERGLAVLALVGNMVTAWSWFGTNQLGVGLHAYGFNNSLAVGCTVFWCSQLGLLGLGLLMPLRFWRAYPETPVLPSPPPPAVPPGPRLKSGRGGTGIQPK
jgi:ABC-type transport system involved in cytochrome c biogenesis permease subunit